AQNFFNNDEHLIASANKACGNFINNNAVTEAANNSRKLSELLARYCDILLRKGKMLANRLVGKLSASNDCEESMILKLKINKIYLSL
ncbi:unnamed protein product, partial [Rotaria sp. Silwood2]